MFVVSPMEDLGAGERRWWEGAAGTTSPRTRAPGESGSRADPRYQARMPTLRRSRPSSPPPWRLRARLRGCASMLWIPGSRHGKRARARGVSVANILTDESQNTGVYYDDKGRPDARFSEHPAKPFPSDNPRLSSSGPDAEVITGRIREILFHSQIPFGRLNRGMPEPNLNLFAAKGTPPSYETPYSLPRIRKLWRWQLYHPNGHLQDLMEDPDCGVVRDQHPPPHRRFDTPEEDFELIGMRGIHALSNLQIRGLQPGRRPPLFPATDVYIVSGRHSWDWFGCDRRMPNSSGSKNSAGSMSASSCAAGPGRRAGRMFS